MNKANTVPEQRWLVRLYLWACARLYAELAWQYDVISWLVSLGLWRQWQAGVWSELHGRAVLDLGCGTGAMVQQGVARSLQMVGLDRSPQMLAVARARLSRTAATVPMVLGDGFSLPLQDATFDGVMATFPAGYILDPITLGEIRRVLRPGGRVVMLGLWVELRLGRVARWLPVFYGRPADSALQAIARRVEAAGFAAHWVEQRHGRFTVGVLVAESAKVTID